MFGIELIIVVIGTIFSAIAGQGPTLSFAGTFAFCRFILGIGVGGDYPISARMHHFFIFKNSISTHNFDLLAFIHDFPLYLSSYYF